MNYVVLGAAKWVVTLMAERLYVNEKPSQINGLNCLLRLEKQGKNWIYSDRKRYNPGPSKPPLVKAFHAQPSY